MGGSEAFRASGGTDRGHMTREDHCPMFVQQGQECAAYHLKILRFMCANQDKHQRFLCKMKMGKFIFILRRLAVSHRKRSCVFLIPCPNPTLFLPFPVV
jgi:hypothetical protein